MMKKQLFIIIVANATPVYADENFIDFISLTQECAPTISPKTMAAIVKTESRFHPWAIGINGGAKLSRQPSTREEAIATAQSLLNQGYNIDLGLGQINSKNLTSTGLNVESAFDPCRNLAASASILQANYQSASQRVQGEQPALHAALSAYNTGSFTKGFRNGYVQKVLKNAGAVTTAPVVPAISSAETTNPATLQTAVNPRPESEAPVKLKAEGRKEAPKKSTNVYNNSDNSVMVY